MARTSYTKTDRKRGVLYQTSVPPPAGAHVSRYAFGDYFVFFSVNHDNKSFDITVTADTPKDIIEDFLSYWVDTLKGRWRVFIQEEAV